LSQAIKRALVGDALAFAMPPYSGPTETFFGIAANACGDWVPDIRSYEDMQQRIQMGRRLAPHLQGASEHWKWVLCIGWPIKAANPPQRLDVEGVPTLIVHSAHDPSVSYKWAFSLAAQIRNSDLLTRLGDGHTSYYTSECARAATDAYLVHPEAAARRVCAQ
jgi:pimeloyl-ACP methyl ester carboxylesterase